MEHHPTASLLGMILITIFKRHMVFRETAILVVELHAVHGQYFREDLCLDLLLDFVNRVAIDEIAFLLRMRM
jgi:hypothetical protein